MKKFWTAIAISLFFYARTDILIWQRIFEKNGLHDLGVGIYHWGWFQSLFGFMALGFLLFYPNKRRMVTFPLTLGLLAFSGLEDILYYWLDGKALPPRLPWLDANPLILQPVTAERLVLSAGLWLLLVIALDVYGGRMERKIRAFFSRSGRVKAAAAEG
jgi:hypothetical protein